MISVNCPQQVKYMYITEWEQRLKCGSQLPYAIENCTRGAHSLSCEQIGG